MRIRIRSDPLIFGSPDLRSDPESDTDPDFFSSAEPDPDPWKKMLDPHHCINT